MPRAYFQTCSLCFSFSLTWSCLPRATFQRWQRASPDGWPGTSDHSQITKRKRNVLGLGSGPAHLLQLPWSSTVTRYDNLGFCSFWTAFVNKITLHLTEKYGFLPSAETDHRGAALLNSFQCPGKKLLMLLCKEHCESFQPPKFKIDSDWKRERNAKEGNREPVVSEEPDGLICLEVYECKLPGGNVAGANINNYRYV